MGPEILVPIAALFTGASIVRSVLKFKERRMELESSPGGGGRESAQRLERMEQAIDAMALEIERVGEAQRFTTRLLTEKGATIGPVGPAPTSTAPR